MRRLLDHLRQVRVDLATLTARVGDHELTATSPDELRRLLSAALYDRLHAGRSGGPPATSRDLTDEDLEERLRAVVPHTRTRVTTSVTGTAGDTVVVTLDGVLVRLPVSGAAGLATGAHVELLVDCVRPRLSPGFLLVDGSAGHGLDNGPVLRVYLNVRSSCAAPAVLGATLTVLEGLGVPYRAKMTSVRVNLPRRDAAVVYLGRHAWHAAARIAAAVGPVGGRGEEVSPYTEPLGSGVSVAWEPTDRRPGYRGLSLGEHRSLVVSTALVEYSRNPTSSLERMLTNEFDTAGTDPRAPFREMTSPELGNILHL